ncbi:MAG: hypothetical protein M9894_15805 [Planctomycetes bacterium]|nr:hypothetical protein [Planctomycetota bacterium]
MRTSRTIVAPFVALAAAMVTSVAFADPQQLPGRWTEWDTFRRRTVKFQLAPVEGGAWQGETRSPRGYPRRLTLTRTEQEGWRLRLEQRVRTGSLVDELLERDDGGWTWGPHSVVALEERSGRLEGSNIVIELPRTADAAAPAPVGPLATGPGALGEPSSSPLPVVRVLLTGFDRFPRPANHPRWLNTPEDRREPSINPSGWAVRNFDPALLDPALRGRVRIEVHRLTDVPVVYVEGARAITDRIKQVDADVAISFGVGSDGNVDADVETTCTNVMHDGSGLSGEGEGPFFLPAHWPPSGPQSGWSAEDRSWLWRYPDNAGVSYNRKKIDPTKPDRLRSTLPVREIVRRCEREGLTAHDGGGGPGQYICNNVMFKVIDTQAERGRIGGFIHMAQWDERKQDRYLKVLRLAVEESVKAVLETRPSN